MNNRKGSILDLGIIIFVLVVLVISSFLSAKFYTEFKTKFKAMFPDETASAIFEKGDVAMGIWINLIPFLYFSCGLGAIVLAFFIPAHPIFMPISIIALVIFIIMSVAFTNVLWEFINSPLIIGIANQYPLVVSVIRYSPFIISVFGFLVIVVMYSKSGIYE